VQGRVLAPYTDDQTYLTITHWFLVFRSRKLLLGNVWNNVSTTETVALSVLWGFGFRVPLVLLLVPVPEFLWSF
jgi:hypothetical protein